MKPLKALMLFLALIGLFIFACEKDEPFNEPEDTAIEEVADLRSNDCANRFINIQISGDTEFEVHVCAKSNEDAVEKAKLKANLERAILEEYFNDCLKEKLNCKEYSCGKTPRKCDFAGLKHFKAKNFGIVKITKGPAFPTMECEGGEEEYVITLSTEKLIAGIHCKCVD